MTLAEKVAAAKVAAGLDAAMSYDPDLFIDHMEPEDSREFWHWQVDRVVNLLIEGDIVCPCGKPSKGHSHGADDPAPLADARAIPRSSDAGGDS
jgi:hypothetical protein